MDDKSGLASTQKNKWVRLEHIQEFINGLNERGIESHTCELDDYRQLLMKKEFQDLVIYELYDTYFYGDRHEFDLVFLEEIVKSVVNFFMSPEIQAENTSLVYHILQSVPALIVVETCTYIKKNLYVNSERNKNYYNICNNVKKIQKYFKKHSYVDTKDIEKIFQEDPAKITPLLKLLGCKHYINEEEDIWVNPVE